jgi:GNAT superfamily N-acetyltransferase
MRIEPLSLENLKDGVYCAAERPDGADIYDTLEVWLESNTLRGLVARDESGEVAGFVLYYPIECAPLDVEGEGLYMVQCLFVKTEYQGKGAGRLLIEGAVSDARANGASGLAVEGYKKRTRLGYDFMPGAFFSHLGMIEGPSRDQGTLYYVNFDSSTNQPRYSSDVPKVKIDILDCRRCYVGISDRKVVDVIMEAESPKPIAYKPKEDAEQTKTDAEMSSGVFIDGKLTFFGPVSEDDMLNAIDTADSARNKFMDR